jgi:hypothetical protein
MPNLEDFYRGIASSKFLPQFWTISMSAILLLWISRSAGRRTTTDLLLVAIVASAPVSYHMLIQDMAILLLPILITIDCFIPDETPIATWERFKLRSDPDVYRSSTNVMGVGSFLPGNNSVDAFMIAILLHTGVPSGLPSISSESAFA